MNCKRKQKKQLILKCIIQDDSELPLQDLKGDQSSEENVAKMTGLEEKDDDGLIPKTYTKSDQLSEDNLRTVLKALDKSDDSFSKSDY